jgi:molecular chaperone GrpE
VGEVHEDAVPPARQPGGSCSPAPATAETAGAEAGQDGLVAGELAERLGRIEEHLAGFHRRAAHRESVIDRLHEENQLLRAGLSRTVLEPVITDLIRLHDQLGREARRLAADGQNADLTWSFADDVAQILERCGIDTFAADPGEPFDSARHHVLAVVSSGDESRNNTVAEVIAAGFTDRDSGRVRRPLQARFYQYVPEPP